MGGLERVMAIHRYICKQCGMPIDTETPIGHEPRSPGWCYGCGGETFRRDYSGVGLARPMMSHWNATTGTEVSDMKGFKDDLKCAIRAVEPLTL